MIKSQIVNLVSSADVSSNITSDLIDLRFNYGFAVQCSFTGSPSGSVIIEGSNDQSKWSQIDSLTISGLNVLSSNKDAIYWPYIRVRKDAGGTGTMTTTITIKGV